jgi:hypothetical protein
MHAILASKYGGDWLREVALTWPVVCSHRMIGYLHRELSLARHMQKPL